MNFDGSIIASLVEEIKIEQHIAPSVDEEEIENYVKDGIFNINHRIGENINYSTDNDAKCLLKNYCLYARYKRLAEFNKIYEGDFVKLQFRYNRDSNI